MSLDQYKIGLSEQYQGEVTGEVALNCLLMKFRSPREQYVLGTVLQLETETKARLRPFLARLGIDITELEESRQMGLALAEMVEELDWAGSMALLAQALIPYVEKYQEIAELAPPEYKEVAELMAVHERSLQELWEEESREPSQQALDEIVRQLRDPLPYQER